MPLIINLKSLHEYDILETMGAFAELSKEHSNSCVNSMPNLFQHASHLAWVAAIYAYHNSSLIEPYKLGQMTTEEFLEKLSKVFYFMDDMPSTVRHEKLAEAWTSSIHMSLEKQNNLAKLIEQAEQEPVYLISNTNELDVQAIIKLLKQLNPDTVFNPEMDTSIKHSL